MWVVSTMGGGSPTAARSTRSSPGTGFAVAVSDRADVLAAAESGSRSTAELPEWLAPIVAVIPGQVAALRLGELSGVDLDQPHGLGKVTLTYRR